MLVIFLIILSFGVAMSSLIMQKHAADRKASPVTESSNAAPPRNGSIRAWEADGHWWIVGDGWGQHHPDCPCRELKVEVE
jgi:hypothetical protein